MRDDFKAARLLGVVFRKDLEEAWNGAESGENTLLLGHDSARGTQLRIDNERRGRIQGRLVFTQGLFEECGDAFAFPVHKLILQLQNADYRA